MNSPVTLDNPFTVLRLIKAAQLSGTIRSAEKALRKAEAARRKALEDQISTLQSSNESLQEQAAQANQMAAQSGSVAQALASPMPTPPAAQPPYGMMATMGAGDPNAEQQPAQ